MQRFAIHAVGKWSAELVEGGAWVRFDEAQTELTAALDQGKAEHSRAKRWESAAGDAIVERDKLKGLLAASDEMRIDLQANANQHKISMDAACGEIALLTKERDTLKDILALLAPDLKVMAILYAQQGQNDRAQALADIAKSVGVV